jgi:O-Antigen ligase
MRFFLFLLANALLFIRPSEFVADLAAIEIYRWFILACLLVSLPVVIQRLSLRFPGVPPIGTCVFLLLPAVFLSGFFHGNFELIQDTVTEYMKVLIYFVLMIGLLTDVAKLKQFLRWIAICSAVVALIAVLRYHADIAMPATPRDGAQKKASNGTFVVDEVRDANTGEVSKVQRMCGTGIFNDPNDLALVLVTAIPICLCWLTDPTKRSTRPLWFGLMLFFCYALMLTYSRGGFLALMAGVGTWLHLRYGGKKTILLGAMVLPVLLLVFAGRMTSISADEGTGQTRLQLWAEGLQYFRMSPLFGIGMDNYRQFSSHVAHHSFIHCYTELGLIGGTLFFGAFYLAVKGMLDARPKPDDDVGQCDPELRRLHPFLTSALVAYTIGICFLSRSYVVPTYMMLGMAAVYLRLRAPESIRLPSVWSVLSWPKLAGLSCAFLAACHVFVRVFAG